MIGSFIPCGTNGRLFVATYAPEMGTGDDPHIVVVAPAFAEEMNRSRRTLHNLGIELARRNIVLIVPDLTGTGDSSGDLEKTSWQSWKNEISEVLEWSGNSFNSSAISLLGIRMGALLALDPVIVAQADKLVLWQPVTNGQSYIRTLLRTWHVANFASGNDNHSAAELLQMDGQLEVAGYILTIDLINEIKATKVDGTRVRGKKIEWFETGANLLPGSAKTIDLLQEAGSEIRTHCIDFEPFWRIQETITADVLVASTISCLVNGIE